MKPLTLLLLSCAMLAATSCDEGDIYPTTAASEASGFSVRLTAETVNANTWPDTYKLALAGFTPADEYAAIAKIIEPSATIDVILSGIPMDVTSVELCVLDGLRRRVTTIASLTTDSETEGKVRDFDAGKVDAGIFDAIQREIFSTTCANCHGASNHAAAGLYLTPGQSRASLVNQPSVVVDGAVRVVPGNSAASILYQALSTDVSASWHYDHSVELPSAATLELIRSWIDDGAK